VLQTKTKDKGITAMSEFTAQQTALWNRLKSLKLRKTKTNLRKGNCYCVHGQMCEAYRLETGMGEWIKRNWNDNDDVYTFRLGNVHTGNSAPDAVLEAYGINTACAEKLIEYNDEDTQSYRMSALVAKVKRCMEHKAI
jgi:hypothetical protein